MTQVKTFPHSDKETYVITRTPRPPAGRTTFYVGDVGELVRGLKSKSGRHIFVDGGAEIVDILLKEKLIDEFYISVIPILLGDGVRLFKEGEPEQPLILAEIKYFETGLVQMHYMLK